MKEINSEFENGPLYDLSSLKEIAKGSKGFLEKMILLFCEHTPITIQEMKKEFLNRNYENMGAMAHKLKPSIDSLAIHSLKQVIRDIEKAGKSNSTTSILESQINTVEKISKTVIENMKKEYLVN